jgi:hypothetical protein
MDIEELVSRVALEVVRRFQRKKGVALTRSWLALTAPQKATWQSQAHDRISGVDKGAPPNDEIALYESVVEALSSPATFENRLAEYTRLMGND